MKKCLIVLLASAFTGETVPLIFMYVSNYISTLKSMVIFNYVEISLWPSSIFLMLTGAPDPRTGAPNPSADAQMLVFSIMLNVVLYSVIGLAIWFLWFLFQRRRGSQ
jgi:hypothetical protein